LHSNKNQIDIPELKNTVNKIKIQQKVSTAELRKHYQSVNSNIDYLKYAFREGCKMVTRVQKQTA
jgi:hypothetical protein